MKLSLIVLPALSAVAFAAPAPTKVDKSCAHQKPYKHYPDNYYGCQEYNKDEWAYKAKCIWYKPDLKHCKPDKVDKYEKANKDRKEKEDKDRKEKEDKDRKEKEDKDRKEKDRKEKKDKDRKEKEDKDRKEKEEKDRKEKEDKDRKEKEDKDRKEKEDKDKWEKEQKKNSWLCKTMKKNCH
ncbi:uncharacterized protein M421DRAFT_425189 [Didymella exigua CBS 183.55]|uniref:Uncharacterized protein n=1 Tax=Didymella exigua CBS 183.55 TaxID=1150837 RepID=A0A6A5RBH7_9PLEO|nr:uncharacterized protein M421DRAFT_425189 [Didymella exigua CBS 183.55]KAF1924016.1 hypothetical protein M421DRAFT_425189 [Didymella exigua CBS 183.55]